MKIATWNLESIKPLTTDIEEAFRKVIYGINADVWVVTETWLNFSLVGYQLAAQTGQVDDLIHAKRPFSRWVAIWSRLKARQLEVVSDPERMACIRIEEGSRPVVVVGTVLPWGSDKRHPLKNVTSECDAASADFCQMLQAQSEEWRQLWSTPDKTGFCVAGDFNQESLSFPNPQGNKRRICINQAFTGLDCLTNNMKVVYPKAESHLNPHPTIDHICVGGGLKLRAGTTPTTWDVPVIREAAITDHAGVTVDLTF
jgi:endonuclease/exonuclease/phosphatase family metal-dependent hydrolase